MDEISSLQKKIKELQALEEAKKKELNLKETSLEHNMSIINEIYLEKKGQLERNDYSKSCIVAKFQDQKLVSIIEALLNSLTIINNRLVVLEEKLS